MRAIGTARDQIRETGKSVLKDEMEAVGYRRGEIFVPFLSPCD
jgi:hypothetical protein